MGNIEIEHARHRAVIHHAVVRREIAVTHHLNWVLRRQEPVVARECLESFCRLVKSSKQSCGARQRAVRLKSVSQRMVGGLALEIRQGFCASDDVDVDHFRALQKAVGADVTKQSMYRSGVGSERPDHVGSDSSHGIHSSHEHVVLGQGFAVIHGARQLSPRRS